MEIDRPLTLNLTASTMPYTFAYPLLADIVLAVHVAIVAFVVGGLVTIIAGNLRGWHWVNRRWFRLLHLAAIAIVAAQAWLGVICPLTTLEMWLRAESNLPSYSGSFIGHWLQAILYIEAPAWVFTLVYTVFGLLVAATWLRFPPARQA